LRRRPSERERRKAARYLNRCCVYVLYIERILQRRTGEIFVCVFHYDYFPVASFFLLLLLLPTSSSSRQTRQPSSHMFLVSLSLSCRFFCHWMLNQNNKQMNWSFSCSFPIFFLYSLIFLYVPFFYSIY